MKEKVKEARCLQVDFQAQSQATTGLKEKVMKKVWRQEHCKSTESYAVASERTSGLKMTSYNSIYIYIYNDTG